MHVPSTLDLFSGVPELRDLLILTRLCHAHTFFILLELVLKGHIFFLTMESSVHSLFFALVSLALLGTVSLR